MKQLSVFFLKQCRQKLCLSVRGTSPSCFESNFWNHCDAMYAGKFFFFKKFKFRIKIGRFYKELMPVGLKQIGCRIWMTDEQKFRSSMREFWNCCRSSFYDLTGWRAERITDHTFGTVWRLQCSIHWSTAGVVSRQVSSYWRTKESET